MDINRIIFDIYNSHAKLNPSTTDRNMKLLNTYMKKTFMYIKTAFSATTDIEDLLFLNDRVNLINFNIEKIYHILSFEQIEEYEIYIESAKINISTKIDKILYNIFYHL
jgi:hypothetical protein